MPDLVIISDASPLIAFVGIGELALLSQLYNKIIITDVVRAEIHANLPAWIYINKDYDKKLMQLLELELDAGEASAIALALKSPKSTIILDESKGRSVAKRLGLNVTGTVGIIIKAKEQGLIKSGSKILDKLEEHGFWLSKKLKNQILKRLRE